MLPHQRRELAAGNNFTFSSPAHRQEHTIMNRSDEMEYDTWAERIKGQYNHFGKPNDAKFGAWTRRNPKNINPDEGEFMRLAKAEEDNGSGTPSPELWKRSEESLVLQSQSAGSSPARSYGYSHVSHGARAQTIAKYRQEMLDLVRGMPETAYELSLRDIVESPKITTPLQEDKSEELGNINEDSTKTKKKKKEKKGERRILRTESIDAGGGLFLKLFIPKVPNMLGSRKSSASSETCAKVSPNLLSDGERSGSEKSSKDREWWSSEFGQMTSSSGSSGSSNSSGSSSSSRKLRGCYPFFQSRQGGRG